MKTLIALFAFGLLCPGIYSQGSWTVQPSGTTRNLNSVFLVDSNTGYAVGEGATILKTTNGGSIWDGFATRGGQVTFFSVFGRGREVVYAVGQNYSSNPASHAISKSFDGLFFTFVLGDTAPNQELYSIHCTDANNCYSVGNHLILKTIDGGSSWSKQTNSIINSNSFYSIYCTGPNVCYATGTGVIIKTLNGGADWTIQYNGTATLRSVFFIDPTTGYAVGDSSVFLKTTTAGASWGALAFPISNQKLNSVHFPNATIGYVVGNNGNIFRTANAGTTWTQQASGTSVNLNSVSFSNANTGYAVGNSGIILKYSSGPSSSIRSGSNATVPKHSHGSLLRTTSAENSWIAIFANGVRNLIQK